MSKLFLIISREFSTRVRKKSFILLTILMPFIMGALVFVPIWLATLKDNDQKVVALYDATGRYATEFSDTTSYRFERIASPDDPGLYGDDAPYEAVVVIRADLSTHPDAVTIYAPKEVPAGLFALVDGKLSDRLHRDKLAATGIDGIEQIIDDVQTPLSVQTVKRSDDGSTTSSSTGVAIGAGFLFTFLIYMFVMAYGATVMQSVLEEKTNRIVEVMVSSVKPFQLMMGKIIGVALVGLLQMFVWTLLLGVLIFGISMYFGAEMLASSGDVPSAAMATAAMPPMDPAAMSESGALVSALVGLPYAELLLCFILYFIGGYLLYASIFAAIGASVNTQEDSSQFMMPMILILIFGLYAAMGSAENTDGPLAFWSSLFPLTAPVVMMVRIPFGVPLWQELLSLVLLYGTALGLTWVGGRIYRVGILMYGKKPTLKEMIKWMRYK